MHEALDILARRLSVHQPLLQMVTVQSTLVITDSELTNV